jgi:hypothetical protein
VIPPPQPVLNEWEVLLTSTPNLLDSYTMVDICPTWLLCPTMSAHLLIPKRFGSCEVVILLCPVWSLASSIGSCAFHLCTPGVFRSFSTLSSQLCLGLPPIPVPSVLANVNFLHGNKGHAIAQPVSRRLPTAAARVRTEIRTCGTCGGQSGTGIGFLRVLQFPLLILLHIHHQVDSVSPHSKKQKKKKRLLRNISFTLLRCPSHLSLLSLRVFTISRALYCKSYSS